MNALCRQAGPKQDCGGSGSSTVQQLQTVFWRCSSHSMTGDLELTNQSLPGCGLGPVSPCTSLGQVGEERKSDDSVMLLELLSRGGKSTPSQYFIVNYNQPLTYLLAHHPSSPLIVSSMRTNWVHLCAHGTGMLSST